MNLTKSIFGIHAIFASNTNKNEADEFIKLLVSNTMSSLQEEGNFTPENLEKALANEFMDFKKMSKKKVA